MGDRVLMQIVNNAGEFGPVVYGHDAGVHAPMIVRDLVARMAPRGGDVTYWSARLVQEVSKTCTEGSHSLGMWNAEAVLTAEDSHGDGGVVIINADTNEATYMGGYYNSVGDFADEEDFDMEIINRYRAEFFAAIRVRRIVSSYSPSFAL